MHTTGGFDPVWQLPDKFSVRPLAARGVVFPILILQWIAIVVAAITLNRLLRALESRIANP